MEYRAYEWEKLPRLKRHPFHSYFITEFHHEENQNMFKNYRIELSGWWWTGNMWSDKEISAAVYRNENTYNRAAYFSCQTPFPVINEH